MLKALIISILLIGSGMSVRLNIEDMDYNSLISLLSEYDGENADEIEPVINNVSQESNIPKYYAELEEGGRVGGTRGVSISEPSSANLAAAPHVGLFNLLEAFLRLKGEMATRIYALIYDNFDLFKSVYSIFVRHASKLHSFTLIGIKVLQNIVEYSLRILETWKVTKPTLGFGVQNILSAMQS